MLLAEKTASYVVKLLIKAKRCLFISNVKVSAGEIAKRDKRTLMLLAQNLTLKIVQLFSIFKKFIVNFQMAV